MLSLQYHQQNQFIEHFVCEALCYARSPVDHLALAHHFIY